MQILESKNIESNRLNSAFLNTTNSYKFYWFKAIIQEVNSGKIILEVDQLILRMICEAWHPIINHKISFGRQDLLYSSIVVLKTHFNLNETNSSIQLFEFFCKNLKEKILRNTIQKLSRWVPERFIRPWFHEELQGIKDALVNRSIRRLANSINYSNLESPIYKFREDNCIQINDFWRIYISTNVNLCNSFTNWHLIKYLAKRNPNVPNLSEKLTPILHRELSLAKYYWGLFLKSNFQECIYSNIPLENGSFSLDHFLPWSYVGHDMLWNLIPTHSFVNSSKRNELPDKKYLLPYCSLQFDALKFYFEHTDFKVNILEDYIILFDCSIIDLRSISKEIFIEMLIKTSTPQMQIASNMGFNENWLYRMK